MKHQGLYYVLDCEAEMAYALIDMQNEIDMGHFLNAMACQFEHLYLQDEWENLLFKHYDEYRDLLNMANGRA